MINRLLTLQTQLSHITDVYVSAGRPSAPVGGCERIYVWLEQVEDGNLTDSCMTKTRIQIGYEVWACYNDDAEDMTADVFLQDATRFTDLVEQTWETIVSHKDLGDLAGASSCDQIDLLPLRTQQRAGQGVSALGAIVV